MENKSKIRLKSDLKKVYELYKDYTIDGKKTYFTEYKGQIIQHFKDGLTTNKIVTKLYEKIE